MVIERLVDITKDPKKEVTAVPRGGDVQVLQILDKKGLNSGSLINSSNVELEGLF